MGTMTYTDEVFSLRDSFNYELCEVCECGLSDHVIAPDPLGHAHSYCLNSRENAEYSDTWEA